MSDGEDLGSSTSSRHSANPWFANVSTNAEFVFGVWLELPKFSTSASMTPAKHCDTASHRLDLLGLFRYGLV